MRFLLDQKYTRPALRITALVTLAFTSAVAYSQTYALSTLATFNNTNGKFPLCNVVLDSAGDLYGTTYNGGANGAGTVFEIAAGTTTVTTLVTFNITSNNANGAYPYGGLTLDSKGNLYGTTANGGTQGRGTIFEIAAGTHAFSTLASLTSGASPSGNLAIDGNGNLYGTTQGGGTTNDGTVFELAAGSQSPITLANFNGTDGNDPSGGVVIDSHGNLFGTTQSGGTSSDPGGDGTVFEVATGNGNALTTIANFNRTNGKNPIAGVTIDSSGNLYGTTVIGGVGTEGTVFKIAAGSTTVTTLATFAGGSGPIGDDPVGGVILDSSGNLFGTTEQGGVYNSGSVFEISEATNSLSVLASFTGSGPGTTGIYPQANLTLDSAGNLYGTTQEGGTYNDGTVFEVKNSAAAPEPNALVLFLPAVTAVLATKQSTSRRRRVRSAL